MAEGFMPYLTAVSAAETPAPEREHALRFLINETYNTHGRWSRQYDAVLAAACAALSHSSNSPISTMLSLWLLFHVALVDARPLQGKVEVLLANLLDEKTSTSPEVLEKACWLLTALSSAEAPSSLAEAKVAAGLARLLQVRRYGEALVHEALQPLKNLCHESCAANFQAHIENFRAADGLANLRQILTYPRRSNVTLHSEAVAFVHVLTQDKDAALLTALVESGVLGAVAGLFDAPTERSKKSESEEGDESEGEGHEEALASILVNFSTMEPSEVSVASWAGAGWRAVLLLRLPGPYARPSTRRLLTQLALNLSTHEHGRQLVCASPHMRPFITALLEQLSHAKTEPEGSDAAESTENILAFLLNLSTVPLMRLEIAARDSRPKILRALAQRAPERAEQLTLLEANLALKSAAADLQAWEARCKEEDYQVVEIETPALPTTLNPRPHAPPRAAHSPIPTEFHSKPDDELLLRSRISPRKESPSPSPQPAVAVPQRVVSLPLLLPSPIRAPAAAGVLGDTPPQSPAPVVVLTLPPSAPLSDRTGSPAVAFSDRTESHLTRSMPVVTLQREGANPARVSADGVAGPVAAVKDEARGDGSPSSPNSRSRSGSSGILVANTMADGQYVEMRSRKGSLSGKGVRWDAATASSHTRVDAAKVRDHRRPETEAGTEAEVLDEKRANLVAKFLETEMDHCLHLQNSFKIFYKPLASGQVEGVGSREVTILFTNMDRLLKLTGRFFLKLNARIGQWDTASSCLGDLFVAFLSEPDVGKEYCTYMAGLEEAISLYNRRHSDNERFRSLMEDCVDEKTNWLFLPSFLQLPLYRISQYRDWLSRMRKLCPNAHADHALLGSASTAAEALLARMHDSEARSRNIRRSTALHTAFGLEAPTGRAFLREGTLQHLAPEGGAFVALHLFSDCLLWATPPALDASVPGRLLHNFALTDFTVTDLPDTSTLANAFRFTVKGSAKAPAWATGKPMDVCTGRKSDKLEWIEALAGAQQRASTPRP